LVLPLYWRVFAVNATVLTVAAVALVVSPLTISFAVAVTELVVLSAGLVALLLVNLALLRRVFGPLSRLTRFMRGVDPLRPGSRVPLGNADPEIAELTDAFNDMIERLESERRDSALRALAAQEDERRRIALELHDEVGQALTAAMLGLESADVNQAREGRREALTNAARHAEADAVRFSLGTEEGKLVLTVADDGRGFDPASAAAGAGIRGMRERALLVRAELEIESAPGGGTTVQLRMPA
jgi:signal transduction histidine kinase